MKDSTKGTLTVFALVFGVGLMCGIFGFVAGIAIGENRSVERFLSIEKRLDRHHRIHLAFVTHLNTFYEYWGVKGRIGSVEQDTVIALPGPVILDHDPIPPPAGFGAIIERTVYQKIEKQGKWEWDPEIKKWEKTETQ